MTNPETELQRLADEFRHLRDEHRREGELGSWRRRLQSRMSALEQQFTALSEHWLHDPSRRAAWLDYLHKGGPLPDAALRPPVLFRGRSENGSTLEIRRGPDAQCEVVIDGAPVARLSPRSLRLGHAPGPVRLFGHDFIEEATASPEALEALRAWVLRPNGDAPWQHAPELFEDGTIDPDFGLTERGRRLLSSGDGKVHELYLR
jgi:hypothetical protein